MQVYIAVERHIDWNIVRCLVIAGPGFMKDQFKEYLHAEAVRRDTRSAPNIFSSVCFMAHMHSLMQSCCLSLL